METVVETPVAEVVDNSGAPPPPRDITDYGPRDIDQPLDATQETIASAPVASVPIAQIPPKKDRSMKGRLDDLLKENRILKEALSSVKIPEKPKDEDFETIEEKETALDKYTVDLAAASAKKAVLESQLQSNETTVNTNMTADRQAALTELVTEGPKKYEGFVEKISATLTTGPNGAVSNELADAIFESTVKEDIAWDLANNPELLKELSGLSGAALAKQIGRLEMAHELRPAKRVTKAPAPIIPIDGGGAGIDVSPEQMNEAQYLKDFYARHNATG